MKRGRGDGTSAGPGGRRLPRESVQL